jgi:CDP-6-deoxy-D-xylo-4-hexulose-3-dehydrase
MLDCDWSSDVCSSDLGKRFDWQLGDLPKGYDHKYTYSHLGYNLKITDMQAACALAQLDRLPGFIEARRRNFDYLSERLASCAELIELPAATPGSEPSWFGYPITLKPEAGINRVDLLNYLDQHKIGTRLLFAGNLTRQPYFTGRKFRAAGSLAITDHVMRETFWVGTWPGLSEAELDYITLHLKAFMGLVFEA